MRVPSTIKVGLVGLIAVSGSLVAGGVASADYAPQAGDIVSVGGDTPQFELSFLANGDFNGNAGFNSSGAFNRLVPFDATADANGRSAYANGSTLGTPINLNPTVIYRAGTYPVQRNSSSGNALNALLADTNGYINFISSTTLPTGAQQTAAGNKGWGFLHVVQIADDAVKIATTSTTNAPANLSIDNLLKIYTGVYTKWSDIPGNSGGSGDTIIPLLPPTSSAIYKSLLADLKTANGNVTPTLTASRPLSRMTRRRSRAPARRPMPSSPSRWLGSACTTAATSTTQPPSTPAGAPSVPASPWATPGGARRSRTM